MPLRSYSCGCGNVWDELIDGEYPKYMKCPRCGWPAQYRWAVSTFTAPVQNFRVDFQPGYDLAAGRYFDTRKDRNEWAARNNVKMDKSSSGSMIYTDENFVKRNFMPKGTYTPRRVGSGKE